MDHTPPDVRDNTDLAGMLVGRQTVPQLSFAYGASLSTGTPRRPDLACPALRRAAWVLEGMAGLQAGRDFPASSVFPPGGAVAAPWR